MRVLFDIGHPAHVHYFRNLIKILEKNNHKVLVIARDRYPIFELLDYYEIEYYSRGKGSDSRIGKMFYLIFGNFHNFYKSIFFKPDLLISHGGTYTAFISWLLRKKSITTEDTEHAINSHKLALPFTTYMLTPHFFKKELGSKQVRFKSFMELAYLYPKYFTPDEKVLDKYNLRNKKYVLFRFVNWTAHHDNVDKIVSVKDKIEIVRALSEKIMPVISSEGKTPNEIKEYEIKIEPQDFHSLLFYASLHIGEGATTASESVLVGTPAIYINPLKVSNIELQKQFGLSEQILKKEVVIEKAKSILNTDLEIYPKKLKKLLDKHIDFTEYMYDFIIYKVKKQ